MSTNWLKDIHDMHTKFGVRDKVSEFVDEGKIDVLREYLKFRIDFIREELIELECAYEDSDPEEIVDALIDIVVVAIGTLDAFSVNGFIAWDEVLRANMSKEPGMKASRPNKFGFPDLIKKEGWVGPDHSDNHGLIGDILTNE